MTYTARDSQSHKPWRYHALLLRHTKILKKPQLEKNALPVVLLLGFVLRLLVFFALEPWTGEGQAKVLQSDAYGYHILAVELEAKHTFGADSPYLSALRTPGYPLFLAIIYTFWGERPWVAIFYQILLDIGLLWILYRFVVGLLGTRAAFWAGFFYAIDPTAILFTNTLLSDALFVFLIFLASVLFWQYRKSRLIKFLILSFIVLAAAAYVRPVGLYLFIFYLPFLYFMHRDRTEAIQVILLAASVYLLCVTPWIYRNYQKHGHFFFSTCGTYNSLVLYAAEAESIAMQLPVEQVKNSYIAEMNKKHPELTHGNIYNVHQDYQRTATNIFIKHPTALAQSFVRGWADMFLSVNMGMWQQITGEEIKYTFNAVDIVWSSGLGGLRIIIRTLPALILLYSLIVILITVSVAFFALSGIYVLCREKKWIILMLLAVPILYFIVLTGPAGLARFRWPATPFLAMLAGTAGCNHIAKEQNLR